MPSPTTLSRAAKTYGLPVLRGRGNLGWCPVCESRTVFVAKADWLRDNYVCLRCRSIPRHRALITVLSDDVPDWRTADIYESGPSGASSVKLAKECAAYLPSHFRGATGARVEDLEALTFPGSSFDVVVTQDVFEHILRPRRAFAELARVLRPGGCHVFTLPYYRHFEMSVVRAEPGEDGEVRHLLPPDYHKDPVDLNGSLVVTQWGRDLPDVIYQASGMTTTIHQLRDRHRGIDGKFIEVFVSRKPITSGYSRSSRSV